MATTQPDFEQLQREIARSIHDHWVYYLIKGIVLLLLGLAAIVVPPVASVAVAILIGWLFLISGLIGLVMTFVARQAPGFWWSLASAVLAIVAGALLIGRPLVGVLSLTLVLVVFFLLEGMSSIMFALEHRNRLPGHWGWMVASGVVSLVLAAIILAGLPGTAAWAIGLIVGINLIFGGTSLIGMALGARKVAPAAPVPAQAR